VLTATNYRNLVEIIWSLAAKAASNDGKCAPFTIAEVANLLMPARYDTILPSQHKDDSVLSEETGQ